jgi:hypothetical protein
MARRRTRDEGEGEMTENNKRLFQEMVTFLGGDPVAKRSANGLLKIGVRTPQQLIETPLDEIRDVQQIGVACVERIVRCITPADRRGPLRDPVVDFERVARYFYGLRNTLLHTEVRLNGVLTLDERTYVADEVGRLADWYTEIAREWEKKPHDSVQ